MSIKLNTINWWTTTRRSAIRRDKARFEIRARIFRVRGQEAFQDIRVFESNASRYHNATLSRCHEINDKEKKQYYNNRILQIEHGPFTPLIFSIYGSMGRECTKCHSKLAEFWSDKRKQNNSLTVNWFRGMF